MVLVKANTGEKIWETNRFKGGVGKYIYDAKRNEIVMINFKPTALGALFAGFKNQLVKLNAANGEILWDATFLGTIEKELVTRRAIVDLWIKGDKIFMYLNGLQVYNINNGQKLWEAIYENDMDGGKGMFSNTKLKKYYRTIADPVFIDNSVYIVMLGTRDRTKYVEKTRCRIRETVMGFRKNHWRFQYAKCIQSRKQSNVTSWRKSTSARIS